MGLPTLMQPGKFHYGAVDGTYLETDEDITTKQPIDIICSILNQMIAENEHVYIIKAFTGAGKSTVLPPAVYRQVLKDRAMIMAEPRVNLCDNGVNDILNFNPWTIGKEITIHAGNKNIPSTEKRFIEFCTTQVISNHLSNIIKAVSNGETLKATSLLNKYQVIVIDEAHILEIQTIEVIKMIKTILQRYGKDSTCPLFVFASATLDVPQLFNYFNLKPTNRSIGVVEGVPNYPITVSRIDDPTLIKLQEPVQFEGKSMPRNCWKTVGRQFTRHWLPVLFKSDAYVDLDIDGSKHHLQCRDALIFVPGVREIETVMKTIYDDIKLPRLCLYGTTQRQELVEWRKANQGQSRVLIIGYGASYSELTLDLLSSPYEQDLDVCQNETKVIVSTAVIETGKTFKLLRLCVDTGFSKLMVYDPLTWSSSESKLKYLRTVPLNKSQATQRNGRVGREAPGVYVSFFSNETHQKLMSNDIPATINSACLSKLIRNELNGVRQGVIDVSTLNGYLYPISPDVMIRTCNDLFMAAILGANGEWIPNTSSMERARPLEQWHQYARIAYYVMKMSLFRAIMTAAINQYSLPDVYHVSRFDPSVFEFTLETCISKGYVKAKEFIPMGKQLFLSIIQGQSRLIAAYRNDIYDVHSN